MLKKQRGLTAISWIIVIAFLGVQGMMALRIIPLYMNYNSAKSIMDNLVRDPDVAGKSPKEIKDILGKRLDINNLYILRNNKDAFKFEKAKKGLVLVMNYEERGPIFGNLEFVATFQHEVVLPLRQN
ncbi:MAG: DUF4845 domain-containing protein [Gammaproteobacteria bacterium]|nr:DUF4845 domain-containing protein [Gammaproteobacteria bacterium]MDH5734956.1 DUF4845 domain-containing protein [Gammaproteobacteria bacterium]